MSESICDHGRRLYECNECVDDLVASGIQLDKDRITELEAALSRLIDVACQCDGWESFPSDAIEDAQQTLGDSKTGEDA